MSTRVQASALQSILDAVHRVLAERTNGILVAVDGRSGAGKSTVANVLVEALGAAVVSSDDFFAADVSDRAHPLRSSLASRRSLHNQGLTKRSSQRLDHPDVH